MVKIVADSTCDLSEELTKRYGIAILPLHVLLGDREYEDGRGLPVEEIYVWSDRTGAAPKTSAPSVEDAVRLFSPILENGDDIVAFSIAEGMSSSGNSMRLAARALSAGTRVHVIDSANLSTGVGLLAIEAAIMAAAGENASRIAEQVMRIRPYVRSSFIVDTLTYLYRGGRCGGLTAMAGSVLRLHPKIVVAEGKMSPDRKYRGRMEKATMEYVRDLEPELLRAKRDRVFVTYSGPDDGTANAARAYLAGLNYFDEILTTRAGGVISSHCGPGTLGVLFIGAEKNG